jgi:uncharacterized repeat protein (TIGR03803 family)
MTTKRLLGLVWVLGALAIVPAQAQTEVVLLNFAKLAGETPYAGVIRDSAGNLYGTASEGGPLRGGYGLVYKLDTAGRETVLHSFTGGADGRYPEAGLIRDSAGNLYGTTDQGGTAGAGVIYKLDTAGNETVLYTFTGGADGTNPLLGLIRDSAGNLYGTTFTGGTAGAGVVYKVDSAGNETVLHTFTGGADGGSPDAGVIRDSKGNLYGTAGQGGTAGYGAVYKLSKAGKETVLYSFTGGADGANPVAGVIRDSAGNLYGTTLSGGAANFGAVYKVDSVGNETVLYSFTGGADGANPYAGVISDAAGNLYGTTFFGGPSNAGVVYKLDTSGTETVLYGFTGANDGSRPIAGVIRDSEGSLYGTTEYGGKHGRGVIFEIKP